MSTPQQPELHRSRRSKVTPVHPDERMAGPSESSGEAGPVPPANRPGRRPSHEQDKPEGPLPTPRAARGAAAARDAAAETTAGAGPDRAIRRFAFRFEPLLVPAAVAVGVTPWTAWLELDSEELRIRYGPWSVRAPREAIVGAERTGPYHFLKVAGPPRLSLADRGLTLATNRQQGACIRFSEPVRGLAPTDRIRHPAVTVTVEETDELVRLLTGVERAA